MRLSMLTPRGGDMGYLIDLHFPDSRTVYLEARLLDGAIGMYRAQDVMINAIYLLLL